MVELIDIFRICHLSDWLGLKSTIVMSQTSKIFLLLLKPEIDSKKLFIYNACNFTDIFPYGVLTCSCELENIYDTLRGDYVANDDVDFNNYVLDYSFKMTKDGIITIVSGESYDDHTHIFNNIHYCPQTQFEELFPNFFSDEGNFWIEYTYNSNYEIIFLNGKESYFAGMWGTDTRSLLPNEKQWKSHLDDVLELFGDRIKGISTITRQLL